MFMCEAAKETSSSYWEKQVIRWKEKVVISSSYWSPKYNSHAIVGGPSQGTLSW